MANSARTIAILSGKGGAGKTLISVNLAAAAPQSVYLDCDVEEPNGHLFFQPEITQKKAVSVKIPHFHAQICTGCRKCADFCAFHAIAFVKSRPLLFDEICHSCGGCALVCPAGAVTETDKIIGMTASGISGTVTVHTGMLNIGETSGVPVIRALLEKIPRKQSAPVLLDCPPGSACPVTESLQAADFCVLAAEPTLFGAHNLAMVYELVTLLGKPCGVVLNKTTAAANPSEDFCRENSIPILGRIPFDTELAQINAQGNIAVRENSRYQALFSEILARIQKEAARCENC